MKKLLKLIGKYKIFLVFSVIFAAISVVLQLYVPVLFGDAIDEVVSAHQVNFDMMWYYLRQILVFIVMAAQFESLTYPFIIMFSLPFAFSGVLMALFFTNSTLSVMSLLGAIMLIGIVVKNGIVLIDYITLCRERGQSVLHSVVTAGKSRLRPVLMTTATTVLGMIPMAVGGGQGSEMWSPMAIAVIGGLTVSTILTLVLIPTLYCIFAGTGIKHQRKVMKRKRELDVYFEAHKDEIIKK